MPTHCHCSMHLPKLRARRVHNFPAGHFMARLPVLRKRRPPTRPATSSLCRCAWTCIPRAVVRHGRARVPVLAVLMPLLPWHAADRATHG